jgi:hypothetical protein
MRRVPPIAESSKARASRGIMFDWQQVKFGRCALGAVHDKSSQHEPYQRGILRGESPPFTKAGKAEGHYEGKVSDLRGYRNRSKNEFGEE